MTRGENFCAFCRLEGHWKCCGCDDPLIRECINGGFCSLRSMIPVKGHFAAPICTNLCGTPCYGRRCRAGERIKVVKFQSHACHSQTRCRLFSRQIGRETMLCKTTHRFGRHASASRRDTCKADACKRDDAFVRQNVSLSTHSARAYLHLMSD